MGDLQLLQPWDAILGRRSTGKRWGPPDQEGEKHLRIPTCQPKEEAFKLGLGAA